MCFKLISLCSLLALFVLDGFPLRPRVLISGLGYMYKFGFNCAVSNISNLVCNVFDLELEPLDLQLQKLNLFITSKKLVTFLVGI